MKLLSKISVFAILIALTVAVSSSFAQPGLQKAINAQKAHNPNFFKIVGVEATGVSLDDNGNAIIKVYTRDANVRGIPAIANGVKVKTSVVGIIRAGDNPAAQRGKPPKDNGTNPQARQSRPVPIGVSIGTYHDPIESNLCFAGTLGCRLLCVDVNNNTHDHYILSNNHVMAEQNDGMVGDQILQPGTLDTNCTYYPADQIGMLTDFEPIKFNGQTNLVDAAIALTTTSDTGFASPDDAYGAPTSTTLPAVVGMPVQKFGRTTGFTKGTVDSINATVNVTYDAGVAVFSNQVIIVGSGRGKNRSFSDSGDSGSLIVTQADNDPVGLLFAGNSSITIANPIDAVLDTFSGNGLFFFIDDGN